MLFSNRKIKNAVTVILQVFQDTLGGIKKSDMRIVGSTGSMLPEPNQGMWGTNLPSETRQNKFCVRGVK